MADPTLAPGPDAFEQALGALLQALDGNPNSVVTTRGQDRPGPRPAELRAYNPSMMDRIGSFLMGDGPPSAERERLVSGLVGTTGLGTNRASIADLTGVPSIERGVRHVGEGVSEGDWKRGLGGAGEIAMGALPGLSMTRGAAPMLNTLMGTVPRAVGTTAALGGATLPMEITDAQAGSDGRRQAYINADPEVRRLNDAIAAKQRERNQAVTTSVQGLNRQQGDVARGRLMEAIQSDIAQLETQRDAAFARADQEFGQNAPFRDRYPGAAESIAKGGAAFAIALPFANAVKHNLTNRFVYDPSIRRQTATVETALNGGTVPPGPVGRMLGREGTVVPRDANAFATEQPVLRRMLASRDGLAVGPTNYLMNAPLGALTMQEARMIPEEVDAYAFPWGHPTRDAAVNALTSQDYYLSGAVPSILMGGGAAVTGTKLGDMMSARKATPDLDRARVMARMDYKTRREAVDVPPPAPTGPGNLTRLGDAMTNRLVRWIDPPQPGQPGPAPSGPAGTPGSPAPPPGSGGPGPRPGPTPPPPRAPSNPSQAYRDPQKSVARPFLDGEVAAGRNVPSPERVGQEFARAGVPAPTGGDFANRLAGADAFVQSMRAQGLDNRQIAAVLADMMRRNMPGLPAIAAGSIGANMLMSQPDPGY